MTDWFVYHFMNSFPRTSFGGGCRTQQGFRNTGCYGFPKATYSRWGSRTQCITKILEGGGESTEDLGDYFQKQVWIDLCTKEVCLRKVLITETRGNFTHIRSFRIMSTLQAGWYSGFKTFFSLVPLCGTKIYKKGQESHPLVSIPKMPHFSHQEKRRALRCNTRYFS